MNCSALRRCSHALLIVLALLVSETGLAQVTAEAVDNRIMSIDKLLHQSSGARQVEDSGKPEARQKHRQAIELLQAARAEHAAGDYAAASDLLTRASREMFAAIRLATPASVASDHEASAYDARLESVVALRDAFTRIANDPGATDDRQKLLQQVDGLMGDAESLRRASRPDDARLEIDKAYHLLKVGIDSIRSGQTLIRSLNFETPRDEYVYEIDRNDTHEMLIGLLVESKPGSERSRVQIEQFVTQARQLRLSAESLADDQAWAEAIELLEQSTRNLVRAIRSAGIYIPG